MEFKQGPLMWEAHGQPMGQSRGDPHQPPDFQIAVRRATMLAADEHELDIEAAVLKEMRQQYQVRIIDPDEQFWPIMQNGRVQIVVRQALTWRARL